MVPQHCQCITDPLIVHPQMVKTINSMLYRFFHNKMGKHPSGERRLLAQPWMLCARLGWGQGSQGGGSGPWSEVQLNAWAHPDCHNEEGLLPRRKLRWAWEKGDAHCRGSAFEIHSCIHKPCSAPVLICITKEWWGWLWPTQFVSGTLKILFISGHLMHTSTRSESKTS